MQNRHAQEMLKAPLSCCAEELCLLLYTSTANPTLNLGVTVGKKIQV